MILVIKNYRKSTYTSFIGTENKILSKNTA
jgi:hypothetical protein